MTELRRNQRGEIGRQHIKAYSCSHFSFCFDHTSPTQTDEGTSRIDHDIGAYVPYSFRTMLRVLLRPLSTEVQGWRRQGQRLNVTAQWRDHLNWERKFTASMISPVFFKDLGWLSGPGLNLRPPVQPTGALPTELTGRRLRLASVFQCLFALVYASRWLADGSVNGKPQGNWK